MPSSIPINRLWRVLTFLALSLVASYAVAIVYANLARHHSTQDGRTPLSEMRVLVTALITYKDAYGSFPENLSALGPSERGTDASSAAANLIDSGLASGRRIGYIFLYKSAASRGGGKNDLFTITAAPNSEGSSNLPHYFVDQTGVIRVEKKGRATGNSAVAIR